MLPSVASDNPTLESGLEGKVGDLCFRADAIEHMTQALESLGIRSPVTRSQLWRSIAASVVVHFIHQVLPTRLVRARGAERREALEKAVPLLHSLAYAYWFDDLPRALDVHLRELNLAARLGYPRALAHAYSAHGIICSLIPLRGRAARYQQRALQIRELLQHRWGLGQSYSFLGVRCYYESDLSQAVAYLRRALRYLERSDSHWETTTARIHLTFCHLLRGEVDAADEASRELLRRTRKARDRRFESVALTTLAETHLIRGNLDQAMYYVERALRIAESPFTNAFALRVKGQTLLRTGDHESAIAILSESVRIVRRHTLHYDYFVPNYIALGEALLRRFDAAPHLSGPARRHSLSKIRSVLNRGMRLARKFRNHLGYALRTRSSFHRLTRRHARAERDLAESAKVLKSQEEHYELARTLAELARRRAQDGDFQGAEQIETAVEIFSEVGDRLELEAARELAVRHYGYTLAGITITAVRDLSHELRTPLNAIILMSEVLTEQALGELNERQQMYIKRILENGLRLNTITEELLRQRISLKERSAASARAPNPRAPNAPSAGE